MKFGSVCSGIEAASVAWHPLGWRAAWLSEIEPFPSAVLAHHYPSVPNLGDMTRLPERIRSGEVEAPDVFCGGTPCQAFSVAGMRKSLADARGNPSLTFCEIADELDAARLAGGKPPAIIFWENVPGVLNTADNAFGCFLAGLAGEDEPLQPPGGKWTNAGAVFGPKRAVAWRVLDAQYFGVAQRRRRVFVVASARAGFDPAAVLFEFEGVRRDSPPSREAGKVAPTIPARSLGGGGLSTDFDCDGGVIQQPYQVANCLTARMHKGLNSTLDEGQTPAVTHSLRGEGFDASGDGTGRGTPLVPVGGVKYTYYSHDYAHDRITDPAGVDPALTKEEHVRHANTTKTGPVEALRTLRQAVGEETLCVWGLGILAALQPAQVLQQHLHGTGFRLATFSRNWVVHCALSRAQADPGWLLQSLREAGCERCASQGWEPSEQLARQLGAYLSELSQPGAQAARFMRDLWWAAQGSGLLREALSAVQEVGRPTHGQSQPAHGGMQVRRLTVEECEFLQGFPRGYTAIPWRGKPADQCPDGKRYKAIGNSWAVPVVRWIGRRIAAQLQQQATNDNTTNTDTAAAV